MHAKGQLLEDFFVCFKLKLSSKNMDAVVLKHQVSQQMVASLGFVWLANDVVEDKIDVSSGNLKVTVAYGKDCKPLAEETFPVEVLVDCDFDVVDQKYVQQMGNFT